jgi:hypothetical protein
MNDIPAPDRLSELLFGAGVALMAWGMGRRRRGWTNEDSMLAVGGGVAVVVAAFFVMGVGSLQKPERERIAAMTHFSSTTFPSLSLDAPDGWVLSHDSEKGEIVAAGPHGSLSIRTSRAIDGDAFLRNLADMAAEEKGKDEGAFNETFDGLAASGRSFRFDASATAAWYVPRSSSLATTIICKVDGAESPRDACRPALSTLKWRAANPP